ncbi:uncharacterized protein LOC130787855 [Actinidia eriantha]|uniref:uncharacterized protein LOC130787855 n=1 Tax=Actinidia eriantha TaxID=165200 RepID=UPI0025857C56|nr:uncharacterized protein LOC130787855 [Actinidia eriantha]
MDPSDHPRGLIWPRPPKKLHKDFFLAVVILKKESVQCRTTNIEPVLEEFIPLKKNCDEEGKIEAIKGGEEGCKKRTGSRAFMSFDECLRKEDKRGLSVAGLSLEIKNPRGKS